MTDLLERCRTAGPDEAGALLRECYRAIFPPRNTLPQGSDERDAAYWRDENFNALVSINTEPALIGAALMLVPEGWEYDMSTVYGVARASININHGPDDGPHYGSNQCGCLSLAILAAVLAAQTPVSIADIGDDESYTAEDPEHWSHQGSNYDGMDCKNCGRLRVLLYGNGRRICEKCNWDQESNDYAIDHNRIG